MLNLHVECVENAVLIECEGRIVQSDSAFALRDTVIAQDARTIVLDLSRVSAIEGGGLGMLIFLQRWAYDHDVRLKLFNPTKSVRDRLEVANSIPDLEFVGTDEMQAILTIHAHCDPRSPWTAR